MNYLLDFLEKNDVEDSCVFELLGCNAHEATLLKHLLVASLDGESSVDTMSFLETHYRATKSEILPYLKEIDHLHGLGFISSKGSNNGLYLPAYYETLELSDLFLGILQREIGKPCSSVKSRSYGSMLDYLDDVFNLVNLIARCSDAVDKNPRLKQLLMNDISYTKSLIEENVSASSRFFISDMFEEYECGDLERIAFLFILYNQVNGISSQVKNLLSVAIDNSERISIQELVSEDSKFVKNDILYLSDFFSKQAYIDREVFVTNRFFNKIMGLKSTVSLEGQLMYSELFDLITPEVDFDDVVLDGDVRHRLEVVIKHSDPAVHAKLKSWGIKSDDGIDSKILLYGDSGTGKTMSAYGIARGLGKKILSLDCSKILSMYVGESEKNVRRIFDEYKDIEDLSGQKPILLLDEADQLLSARGNSFNGTARMYNQMQNIFLAQIEKFNGIIIATTNLLDNLDSAFSRRFQYKIKFRRPDVAQRRVIWNLHLPAELDFDLSRESMLDELSKFDLSGGQIKIVVLNVAYKVALRDDCIFNLKDFVGEIGKEIDGDFSTSKILGFGY